MALQENLELVNEGAGTKPLHEGLEHAYTAADNTKTAKPAGNMGIAELADVIPQHGSPELAKNAANNMHMQESPKMDSWATAAIPLQESHKLAHEAAVTKPLHEVLEHENTAYNTKDTAKLSGITALHESSEPVHKAAFSKSLHRGLEQEHTEAETKLPRTEIIAGPDSAITPPKTEASTEAVKDTRLSRTNTELKQNHPCHLSADTAVLQSLCQQTDQRRHEEEVRHHRKQGDVPHQCSHIRIALGIHVNQQLDKADQSDLSLIHISEPTRPY